MRQLPLIVIGEYGFMPFEMTKRTPEGLVVDHHISIGGGMLIGMSCIDRKWYA